MKKIAIILLIGIIATGCSKKVINTTRESVETTTVDSTKDVAAVNVSIVVKDSAKTEISGEKVKEIINEGGEIRKEGRSRGVITILKIDSTGRVTCEARVDSLLNVIDTLEYWKKHYKTEKKTTEKIETTNDTWADRLAKGLIWPLILVCIVLGLILGRKV